MRLNRKRPRSRPRQRWEDKVKTDLTEISQKMRIEDRDKWRGVIKAAKVQHGL